MKTLLALTPLILIGCHSPTSHVVGSSIPNPPSIGYLIGLEAGTSLVSGTSGQFAGFCDAGAPCAINSAFSWQTIGSINFATLSNATYATDANYTIGGIQWTKINSANEVTALHVTNGVGLVFTPNGASGINGFSISAPLIQAYINQFNGFVPTPNTPIRVWATVTSDNPQANYDQCGIALGTTGGDAGQAANLLYAAEIKGQNTDRGWFFDYIASTTIVGGTVANYSGQDAFNTGLLTLPEGIFGPTLTVSVGTSADAGIIPSVYKLYPINSWANSTGYNRNEGVLWKTDDTQITLWALRSNSNATQYSCTISYIEIDAIIGP